MDRLKTELGSGHRDQTEQLLRDMDALRQRHTASKYLRQAIDETEELLFKLTSLQQERDGWVRERLALEYRLHQLYSNLAKASKVPTAKFGKIELQYVAIY